MQQWSSFQSEKTDWNNLQNKPTILSDNQVTWDEITGKPATYNPSAHTQDWVTITGKPATYTPSSHNHAAGDVTSGTFAIGRIPTGTTATTVAVGNHNHTFSTLTGVALTSPATNQALKFNGTNWVNGSINWTELTGIPSTFTPSAHTHAAANVTSGIFAIERIPTGSTATTVALGNHTHQYADFNSNTFSDEQRIDRGAGSGLNAVFRLFSGAAIDNRAYNIVSNSGGNFALNQSNDANTFSKTVLFYVRNGGLFLNFNGVSQLETTANGVKILNLPTTPAGLPSGHLWRDSNGFVRIV